MRIYKLYAAVSGSGAGAASFQVVRNGRIRRVKWAIAIDAVADNSTLQLELSLQAVTQVAVTNSQGPIDGVSYWGNGTTTNAGAINESTDVDCPVGAGEFVYLNAVVATVSALVNCYVHVEEKGS